MPGWDKTTIWPTLLVFATGSSLVLNFINILLNQPTCSMRFSNALQRRPFSSFRRASNRDLMHRRRGTSSSGGASTLPRITCVMPALVCESVYAHSKADGHQGAVGPATAPSDHGGLTDRCPFQRARLSRAWKSGDRPWG